MLNPYEKFVHLKNNIRNKLILVGVNVIEPNYKPNYRTFLLLGVAVTYFVGTFSTVYKDILNDWKNALSCLCMSGTAVAGLSKFGSAILHCQDMYHLVASLTDLYFEYSKKTGKMYTTLKNKVIIFSYICKIFISMYIIVLCFLIMAPPLVYLTTSKMVFVLQYSIPGIQPFTPTGYWYTVLLHSIMLIYGTIGCYLGDIMFIFYTYHIYVLSQIFKNKTEELNDALDIKGNENQIAMKVMDIAKFHQDFCKFSITIEKMYFWNAFFQISMTSFSICMTLFTIMAGDWPGAPALLIYLIASMYMYCALGTLVEYACEEVVQCICNINWYNLSKSQKKTYQIILIRSQSPTLITVGGIMPLSVSTGLQVTKTIYSFFMMLLQFI